MSFSGLPAAAPQSHSPQSSNFQASKGHALARPSASTGLRDSDQREIRALASTRRDVVDFGAICVRRAPTMESGMWGPGVATRFKPASPGSKSSGYRSEGCSCWVQAFTAARESAEIEFQEYTTWRVQRAARRFVRAAVPFTGMCTSDLA